LGTLAFTAPVTILVGENGSGKSTVLEALALAAGSITIGAAAARSDRSLEPVRGLARQLKLAWTKRTGRGFFLRAEDFFGYARSMARLRDELEGELAAVDREYRGRSEYAQGLARMPYTGSLGEMARRYGPGLDARSHGESFLTLFKSRLVPGGLYLLDEPEAPLSPTRQLALIALLLDAARQGAQFILATHSPIVMACPGAQLLSFDGGAIAAADYRDLEHVSLTRDFLNNPQAFLT
jgi:predicted ATPase